MERKRKRTAPKTDWEQIERDFLASGMSYRALAEKEAHVTFGGRLGEYKYYDMDAVIERALDFAR